MGLICKHSAGRMALEFHVKWTGIDGPPNHYVRIEHEFLPGIVKIEPLGRNTEHATRKYQRIVEAARFNHSMNQELSP